MLCGLANAFIEGAQPTPLRQTRNETRFRTVVQEAPGRVIYYRQQCLACAKLYLDTKKAEGGETTVACDCITVQLVWRRPATAKRGSAIRKRP